MKKLPYFWQSWSWLKKRDQGHLTFTTVYCYNFSILLLIVVNLLPCLIYKLNIITGNKCKGKKNIYLLLYYPSFQASTGGLGTYPLWTRGEYFYNFHWIQWFEGRELSCQSILFVSLSVLWQLNHLFLKWRNIVWNKAYSHQTATSFVFLIGSVKCFKSGSF